MSDAALLCCFGDSNAWGFRPQGGRYAPNERWPLLLGARLGVPVLEAGLPGRTLTHAEPTRGLTSGLADWLSLLARPMTGYVLALGINELAAGVRAEQAAEALATYLDAWAERAADRPLWLVAPAPLGALSGGWLRLFEQRQADSRRLATLWQDLARRYDVPCLDPTTLLEPGGDGLHWSRDDHRRVAAALSDLLRPRLAIRMDNPLAKTPPLE